MFRNPLKETFCCSTVPLGFFIFFFQGHFSWVNVCCHGDYLGLDLRNEGQSLCSCCTTFILMQFSLSFDWASGLFFGCYAVDRCDTIRTDYLLIQSALTSYLHLIFGQISGLFSQRKVSEYFLYIFFLTHISINAPG